VREDGDRQGEGDRFLVGRIRDGDEEAFRQLVDRYTGRLKAYALRRLGRESADVDDALQETFLGLILNIGRLGEVRSIEAYLFSILRNKLVDLARRSPKAHGLVPMPLGSGSEPGLEPPARGASPSHHARREETGALRKKVVADILGEALAGLKSERNFRDLKVLELLILAGMKGKDAAAAVGTSEPTVTRIRTEAIEKLGRLARRHPKADPSLAIFGPDEDPTGFLSEVWRENLLSCPKRSTLGAHALGVLDGEWNDYVAFHLGTVGCETCAANLEDLRAGGASVEPTRERIFTSSVGFLREQKKR
jgi:RNA polymerase sigma-70 factor, ECF subfamily